MTPRGLSGATCSHVESAGQDLAVDVALAHAPRYETAVLGTKVDDDDGLGARLSGVFVCGVRPETLRGAEVT